MKQSDQHSEPEDGGVPARTAGKVTGSAGEATPPTRRSDRHLRLLGEITAGQGRVITTVSVLGLLSTAATLSLPLVVRELVAALGTAASLAWPVALIAVLAVAGAAMSAFTSYMLARLGERMVRNLRTRIAAHALRLPLRTARREGTGNIVARVTSDAALLRAVVDVAVTQVPWSVVTGVLTLVIMGFLDWVLLLVVIVCFSVSALSVALLTVGVRRNTEAQQQALGRLGQRFTAVLGALPTVKAQLATAQMTSELQERATDAADAAIRAARLLSLVNPAVQLGQQVALIGVVIGSGARLATGALAVPDFAAFLLYLLQLVAPLTLVAQGVSRLQTGLAARDRIESLLALPPESDPATTRPVASPGQALEFDEVWFAYDRAPVLHGVSFSLPERGLTALVGPSGAGKTTVLGLVERFHEADRGTVRFLGHPIDQWPLEALRRQLAYLDQSYTLIEGTVRKNLVLGLDPQPSGDEIWAALDAVGLTDAVAALPQELDTELGGSADLSGGQRQRLAAARALLSPAKVVLLDEPTSQLDSISEKRLRVVIDRLARERSVLVVAHRLSTVQHADQVIVLQDGSVTDIGHHTELVERCPIYWQLVHGQLLTGRTENSAEAHA